MQGQAGLEDSQACLDKSGEALKQDVSIGIQGPEQFD